MKIVLFWIAVLLIVGLSLVNKVGATVITLDADDVADTEHARSQAASVNEFGTAFLKFYRPEARCGETHDPLLSEDKREHGAVQHPDESLGVSMLRL